MKRKSQKNNSDEIQYTVGSGNVYEDFGFSEPDEANVKAELAMLITNIIEKKKYTQEQAGNLMGIDQPKVSKITRGILSEFTIERLLRFVLCLGFDIEIRPIRHQIKKTAPTMHVIIENKYYRPKLCA